MVKTIINGLNSMEKLFTYIFYKACKFDEFIYKDENQWSQYYGAIVVTIFIVYSLYLFLDIFFFFFNPVFLKIVDISFNYTATIILISTAVFVNYKKKYKQLFKVYYNFSKKEKRILFGATVLYIALLIVGNIWISEYIREYNITGVHVFEKFHNLKWKY